MTPRSKHAQNRIAYIVYSQPRAAKKLIDQYGYQVPKDLHLLVKATQQLVRKEGKPIVAELMKIHPDRNIILKMNTTTEDNYCDACSSYSYAPYDNHCGACGHSAYTGNKNEFLDQLKEMPKVELEELYDNITKKANKAPDDTKLGEQVRLAWNELRERNKSTEKGKGKEKEEDTSNQTSFLPDGWIPNETTIFWTTIVVTGVFLVSSAHLQKLKG